MVAPPSSVLLDEGVLSELSRPRPDVQVTAYLDTLPLQQTFISTITIAEIERGIVKLQWQDARRAQNLRTWLEGTVLPRYQGQSTRSEPRYHRIYP